MKASKKANSPTSDHLNIQLETIAMKYVLILLPCLLAIVPLFYNSLEPRLFGLPFFYWFQLLLIPGSSLTIFVFHKLSKRGAALRGAARK